MKVKTDFNEELVVPKIIADTYETFLKKEGRDEVLNEDENFYSWWLQIGSELFEPNKSIFVDKEIAKFIIDMLRYFKLDYADAGDDREYESNTSEWFEFKENGYKYSVCAYGTTYNLDKLIGYKEKIIKKEVIK